MIMKESLKILTLSYITLFIIGLLFTLIEDFPLFLRRIKEDIEKDALRSGTPYLTAFLLSMFGNTSIFIVIPYVGIVFIMASRLNLNPLILGMVSGIGAAIGETSSYLIGRGGGKYLERKGYVKKIDTILAIFKKHGRMLPLIIYIFAVTPLPDDIIMIPLGMIGYGLVESLVPCALGKMTLTTVVALVGGIFTIESGDPLFDAYLDLVTIGIIITIIYMVMEVDWEKLFYNIKNLKGRGLEAS